jgi:hypothetical protein
LFEGSDNIDDSTPTPVPGAFTPVFSFSTQVAHDQVFSLNDPFVKTTEAILDVLHAKAPGYEEIDSFGLTYNGVTGQMIEAALLGLSAHLAKVHQTMGFCNENELGGFSPMLPPFLSELVQLYGEFTGPDGRRWLLSDFQTTLKSLVRCAHRISVEGKVLPALKEMWLPIEVDDLRTTHILALRLSSWFSSKGFRIGLDVLWDAIFSGDIPGQVSVVLGQLGVAHRSMVVRLFQKWSTISQFVAMMSDETGVFLLETLDLFWRYPTAANIGSGDWMWTWARDVLRNWQMVYPLFESFFGISFSPSICDDPGGSPIQASVISDPSAIHSFCVKTYYGVGRPERNIICCFGPLIQFGGLPTRYEANGLLHARATLRRVICNSLIGSRSRR